jgi:hypothetical protein
VRGTEKSCSKLQSAHTSLISVIHITCICHQVNPLNRNFTATNSMPLWQKEAWNDLETPLSWYHSLTHHHMTLVNTNRTHRYVTVWINVILSPKMELYSRFRDHLPTSKYYRIVTGGILSSHSLWVFILVSWLVAGYSGDKYQVSSFINSLSVEGNF